MKTWWWVNSSLFMAEIFMDLRADRVKCPTCKTSVARRQLRNHMQPLRERHMHEGTSKLRMRCEFRPDVATVLEVDQLRLGNGWGECHPTKRLNDRASMVQARNRLSAYPGPMCLSWCAPKIAKLVYNSNFTLDTLVYRWYIELVFIGFINVWGAPPCIFRLVVLINYVQP